MEYSAPLPPEDLAQLLPWLEALARRLIQDPGTAQDLAQETLLVATSGPTPGKQSLRPWLRGVLTNRVRRHWRSEERRRAREQASARDECVTDDNTLERAEVAQKLMGLVLAQPEPYRTTLLEHFLEGRSPSEIARRRGLPAPTVRSQLRRGLARMRSSLDAETAARGENLAALLAPLAGAPLTLPLGPLLAKSTLPSRSILVAGLLAAVGALGIWFGVLRGASGGGPQPAAPLAQSPIGVEADSEGDLQAGTNAPTRSVRTALPADVSGKTEAPGVQGRVLDQTGQPLSDVRVLWTAADDYVFPIDSVRDATDRTEPFAPDEVATQADGTFRLPHPGISILRLAIHAKGHAPHYADSLRILSEEAVVLPDIRLQPGCVLTGVVLDAEGLGVSGAGIALEYEREAGFFDSDAKAYRNLGSTDSNGSFRIGDLATGPARLRFSHPSHLPAFATAALSIERPAELRVSFADVDTIEGQVTIPLGGLAPSVSFQWLDRKKFTEKRREVLQRGTVPCDELGRFRIVVPRDPRPSRYRLRPTYQGKSMLFTLGESQEVLAGDRNVLFDDPSFGSLRVELVDAADATPLKEASIALARGHLGQIRWSEQGCVANEGPGLFHALPYSPIKVDLTQFAVISSPGYVSMAIPLAAPVPGKCHNLGRLALVRSAQLSVEVRDEQGNPVPAAQVVLQAPDLPSLREVTTRGKQVPYHPRRVQATADAQGRVEIGCPEGASLVVHAQAEGFALAPPIPVESQSSVALTLRQGAELQVHLKTPAGSDLPGQKVWMTIPDPTDALSSRLSPRLAFDALSDSEGIARFAQLPAGEAKVTYQEVTHTTAVPESGTTVFEIVGQPVASAHGRVLLDGEALAGARLQLLSDTPAGSVPRSTIDSESDGSFHFPAAPCGPTWILIEHPDLALGGTWFFALTEPMPAEIIPLGSATLAGSITGAKGQALPGALVALVKASDQEAAAMDLSSLRFPRYVHAYTATADEGGRFRFEGVPTEHDLVLVAVEEDHAVVGIPVRMEPGELVEDFAHSLPAACTLQWRIDFSKLSLPDTYMPFQVQLEPANQPAQAPGTRFGKPAKNGEGRLERLAPGAWILTLPGLLGDTETRLEMNLTPGETKVVDLGTPP